MTRSYSVFLHLEVTEALRSLGRGERDRILRFANSLALDPFQSGEDVPGFEHLETLPLPDFMNKPPVQVYRFLRDAPGSDGPCD